MAGSPFDSPLLGDLLGDRDVAAILSVETEVLAMLAFEIALAQAEAAAGVIPIEAAETIAAKLTAFSPPLDQLAAGAARDGIVGPAFVRLLRAEVGEPNGHWIHHASTSQDLADSTLMVRLKMLAGTIEARLDVLDARLGALEQRFGDNPLMGRTRMQAALPITVRDRIASWRAPLRRLRGDLPDELFAVQFGGPVGTLGELGARGPAVRAALAQALGLADVPAWHSQRDRIVRIGGWLASLCGALGKIGQDVALMAQNGVDEIALAGGGGSSAMAHKSNPVAAETLVALARYAGTLAGALHQAQVHEQERSGAALTLEWLVVPQLAMATGAALRTCTALAGGVVRMGAPGEESHG